MRNVSTYLLGVLGILLLHACAQPGRLTGGERDERAPVPVYEKSSLQPASLNVKPSRIEIVFDEFIALNNPSATISVTPNTLKLSSKIVGKSLVIDLEGDYLENTTYTIGLNRAVKDITEGNDSLMYFVFSTGNTIDQGTAEFMVQNAFTNKPVKDYVVGLFPEDIHRDSSSKPVYMGQTNTQGSISFNYLREADYFVYAFEDVNKNGALDYGEAGGTLQEAYTIEDSIYATPALLVNAQAQKFRVKDALATPGIWSISFTQSIAQDQLVMNHPKLIYTDWNTEYDSVAFYFEGLNKLESVEAIVHVEEPDTISKKYFPDLKQGLSYSSNLKSGILAYGEDLVLTFNDVVKSIDTSLLALDSLTKHPSFKGLGTHQVRVAWEELKQADSLQIRFAPGSFTMANFEMKDSINLVLTAQKLTDVGTLIIKADSIFPQGFLTLVYNGKEVTQLNTTPETEALKIEHLQAGKYSFRFVYDDNADGVWTPGDLFLKTPAERVVWFQDPTNLRANWEVETFLKFE